MILKEVEFPLLFLLIYRNSYDNIEELWTFKGYLCPFMIHCGNN